MVAKRAAAKSPPRACKVPALKKAKVVGNDPCAEACEAALALLVEDETITEATRSMLRDAAPFAVRKPKTERHEFQAEIANVICQLLRKIESGKKELVVVAEQKVDDVDKEKEINNCALTDIVSKEQERRKAIEAVTTTLKVAMDGLAVAKEAYTTASSNVAALEAEHERNMTDKAEREQFIKDAWQQLLKDGAAPGKMWRERNKLIEAVVKVLEEHKVDGSCIAALPFALKEKAEARGPFTSTTIDFVEKELQASVKNIADKIENHCEHVTATKNVMDRAQQDLKGAEAEKDEQENKIIDAENALLEICEERKATMVGIKKLETRSKELASSLLSLQDLHTEVDSVVCRFEGLVENGVPVVEQEAAVMDVEDDREVVLEDSPTC